MRMGLEGQHRMVGLKSGTGFEHMHQRLGGGGFVYHRAVLQHERVRVSRNHQTGPARRQGRCLGNEPLVPARIEVGVRVDLEKPVLAVVERHGQRARPAWAPRVQRVHAHLAQPGRCGEVGSQGRNGGGALVHHPEVQGLRPVRRVQRTPDGEVKQRVAVRGNADEDGHGRAGGGGVGLTAILWPGLRAATGPELAAAGILIP